MRLVVFKVVLGLESSALSQDCTRLFFQEQIWVKKKKNPLFSFQSHFPDPDWLYKLTFPVLRLGQPEFKGPHPPQHLASLSWSQPALAPHLCLALHPRLWNRRRHRLWWVCLKTWIILLLVEHHDFSQVHKCDDSKFSNHLKVLCVTFCNSDSSVVTTIKRKKQTADIDPCSILLDVPFGVIRFLRVFFIVVWQTFLRVLLIHPIKGSFTPGMAGECK